jgi:hypothetical protein
MTFLYNERIHFRSFFAYRIQHSVMNMYELEWIMFEHLVHCSKSLASSRRQMVILFFLRFSKVSLFYTNFYSDGPARTSLFLSFSHFQKNDNGESATSMAFLNGRSVSDWQSSYSRYTLHTMRRTIGKKVVQNL